MARSYLALGSNLGDRQAHLDRAIQRLRAEPGIQLLQVSSYFETAPVGGPAGQGAYLNAATEIETFLTPEQLLGRLLDIERQFGRVRGERNAPRTLDLDVLLFDGLIRESPDPILPHPRLHQRRFALEPLAEIAPELVHPVLNRSIAELLKALPSDELAPKRYVSPANNNCRELTGLRAVVTGSTRGIGKAIARELAKGGASVMIHGHRTADALKRGIGEIEEFGVRAHGSLADFRDPAACSRFAAEAWNHWGGIDVLVNNAGADLLTGEAPTWSFERKWTELLAVDVSAAMRLSRDIGERMAAERGGIILTMGWDQAETGMEGESGQLFGAAKGAVMAFTRSLARTLAPKVRVNCLAPGWIKTAWGETASENWQSRVRRETPLQRWGLPDDVAATARWLVSPAATFITGQTIRINGGAI